MSTTTNTTAEIIAEALGGDSSSLFSIEGQIHICTLCQRAGGVATSGGDGVSRFDFDDESSMVVRTDVDIWDFGKFPAATIRGMNEEQLEEMAEEAGLVELSEDLKSCEDSERPALLEEIRAALFFVGATEWL